MHLLSIISLVDTDSVNPCPFLAARGVDFNLAQRLQNRCMMAVRSRRLRDSRNAANCMMGSDAYS
jgi:hypothetical protein